MSVPVSYDLPALYTYMHASLGRTADIIGWSIGAGSYEEPAIDALVLCGLTDIAEADDIPKLRAAARLAVWESVAAHTTGYHDFSEDQQTFRMHQVHIQAVAQVKAARKDAARYGVTSAAVMSSVQVTRPSPFAISEDWG